MSARTFHFAGFRLELTRIGKYFLGGLFVLGAAAVNTGNNSLMMLLGMAAGSYVLSGIWSRQVLGALVAEIHPPGESFARAAGRFRLSVHNHSRWPALGLRLLDDEDRPLARIPFVAGRGETECDIELVSGRRGRRQLGPLRLEVLLPLGLFRKSKRVTEAEALVVYPAISSHRRSRPRGRIGRGGEVFIGRGREGLVRQLRNWSDGDELRQVHWKQTAKQGRVIVAERQQRRDEPVEIWIDPRLGGRGARAREVFERQLEEATATIVERLDEGVPVSLFVGELLIGEARHRGEAGVLLEPLALLEPEEAA